MCNFGRRVELLTNLGLIILQAKSFYTLELLICFTLAPVFAQNPTAAKATPTTPTTSEVLQDSLPQNEPLLLDKVRYKAKDSIIIDKKNNKLYLYNEAEMEYQDMLIQSA